MAVQSGPGRRYQCGRLADYGLQSARAAGLQVPNSVLQKANNFLNMVQAPNQLYAYQPRMSPTHVMTAKLLSVATI